MAFPVPESRVSIIADSESFGGDGGGNGSWSRDHHSHCASMEENEGRVSLNNALAVFEASRRGETTEEDRGLYIGRLDQVWTRSAVTRGARASHGNRGNAEVNSVKGTINAQSQFSVLSSRSPPQRDISLICLYHAKQKHLLQRNPTWLDFSCRP